MLRACAHDPRISRSYQDVAGHYVTAVFTARPGKPRDKAKVENAVLQVVRRVLAPLRDRVFFSLSEANEAIHALLEELNGSVSRHLGASRRDLWEQVDRPALRRLSVRRWVFAEWRKCRAGRDCHVSLFMSYYSVP